MEMIKSTPALDAKSEIKLPPVLLEIPRARQGLYLLSGERTSQIGRTYHYFRSAFGADKVFAESEGSNKIPASAEVVFLEGAMTPARAQQMIQLAEDGYLVLAFQSAGGALTVLRRIFSLSFGEGRTHLMARLSEQLRLVAAEKSLPALGGGVEAAREILLISSELRKSLAEEDLSKIEDVLRSDHSSLGSLSMNQSLLQLVIRRRIELKTAFERSPDPAELDRMMKKAGF